LTPQRRSDLYDLDSHFHNLASIGPEPWSQLPSIENIHTCAPRP
jgi:hypothetical protein